MAYFVKVIPPSGRARIHRGNCKFCREGQGMENQDRKEGPTYWYPAYPAPGLSNMAAANDFMSSLGQRYRDTGSCSYCMRDNIGSENSSS